MAEAWVIFVDSNVPMYLVGEPHPNKERALEAVRRLLQAEEILITDVEVYQEILHRYAAVQRFDVLDNAFRALDGIARINLPIHKPHVLRAREILDSVRTISARDALHLAVMEDTGVTRIFSYDRGFDAIPGIERIE